MRVVEGIVDEGDREEQGKGRELRLWYYSWRHLPLKLIDLISGEPIISALNLQIPWIFTILQNGQIQANFKSKVPKSSQLLLLYWAL